MKQVIEAFKRKDAEKRIPVLRLEIDYELATLFDAMASQDDATVQASKHRLEKYHSTSIPCGYWFLFGTIHNRGDKHVGMVRD